MAPPTRPLTRPAPVALLALLVAACAAPQTSPGPSTRVAVPPRGGAPAEAPPPPPAPPAPGEAAVTPAPPRPEVPPPAPAPGSAATATLLERSRQQAAAGHLPLATASLERALRINPRDPALWIEMGRLKLQQGDYAQAESMARRAATVAGGDQRWRGEIDALLDEARYGKR